MCVSSVWNRVYLRCSCALSCPFSKRTWGILLFPERSSHFYHWFRINSGQKKPCIILGWSQGLEFFKILRCLFPVMSETSIAYSSVETDVHLHAVIQADRMKGVCIPKSQTAILKSSLTWGVTQPHLTYFGLSCPGAEGCTCIELLFSWQGRVDSPCLVSRQLHSLRGVAPLPGSHGEARLSDIIRAFLTWINRLKSPGRSTADYWLLCDWQSHLGIYTTTSRLHHLSKLKCSFPNLACCYFHLLENLSVVPRAGEIWQRSTLPFLIMVGKTCNSKVKLKEVLILVQGSWYSPGRNMLCPVPKSLSNITYDI